MAKRKQKISTKLEDVIAPYYTCEFCMEPFPIPKRIKYKEYLDGPLVTKKVKKEVTITKEGKNGRLKTKKKMAVVEELVIVKKKVKGQMIELPRRKLAKHVWCGRCDYKRPKSTKAINKMLETLEKYKGKPNRISLWFNDLVKEGKFRGKR